MSLIIRNNDKILLGIGSFALFRRVFTMEDTLLFEKFLHTDCKKEPEESGKKSVAYGLMTTSLFTKLYLSTFISPVYLSQSARFHVPVFVDEEVEVKFIVSGLEISKSNKVKCTVESSVVKTSNNQIALTGNGLLLLRPETVEILKA